MLSLVVPLYNEEANVVTVAQALLGALRTGPDAFELVLVDNGSRDGTGRLIDELMAKHPEVRKVRVEVNQGYGWGVLCGLQSAVGAHVGFMGGDGQIDPIDVVALWRRAVTQQVDLAKVCRMRREDGWKRRVVTFFCNLIFPLVFPVRTRDINGTPKILRREVYEGLHLRSKDWFLDAEVMIKCGRLGCRIDEMPVTFLARAGGQSNVRLTTLWEFLLNIARARWGGGL
ncbi:MAG: glycosyltransferase family 2 protein [Candidatus Xenobia bacterium]